MLKIKIFRFLSVFCSVAITMSLITFDGFAADEPVGKMASVYAYVLNDYMFRYGIMKTENAGDSIREEAPNGVVYSEIVNFDANENPYLVVFFASAEEDAVSCHIWAFDEEKEEAKQIAALDMNRSALSDGRVGVFSLGTNNEKRYIMYSSFADDALISTDYYTVIEGDAFMYVNKPQVLTEIGVMDFSSAYFHPNVDISRYNATLEEFFDTLKNTAADSVTYENIAERLTDEDEAQMEKVLKSALSFTNFDIAEYMSMDEYKKALEVEPNGDTFYLISEAYALGDEMYYIRFSTDRSYYNYALLRRSDDAENGYQILKVKTDCIPLSDIELKQIKTDYDRNTLLYKKAKKSLKLTKGPKKEDDPAPSVVDLDKKISSESRLPIVCIGGGVAVALLTILWVYLYSDND